MGTVNENIRDDLIEHDIAVRRAIGGEQRLTAAIHRKLEKDVTDLLISSNPTTPLQIARFLKKVRELSAASYREQALHSRGALAQLARSENEAVNSAIEDALSRP